MEYFQKAWRFIVYACLLNICMVSANNTIDFADIKDDWVTAKYELIGEAQLAAFDKLQAETSQLAAFATGSNHPQTAEAKMWYGTVLSTQASVIGGRKALKMVEEARDVLEEAIEDKPGVGGGFGQSVLAALYYRVPGWPIGFKDTRKAQTLLDDALAINPNSVDAHFYYGDLLAKQKKYDEAKTHLSIVLAVAPETSLIKGRQLEANETIKSMPKKHRA